MYMTQYLACINITLHFRTYHHNCEYQKYLYNVYCKITVRKISVLNYIISLMLSHGWCQICFLLQGDSWPRVLT